MKSFTGTTLAEAPTSSNRRQPVRQTRTNPSRSATNPVQPRTSLGTGLNNEDDDPAPGFCPAITHFTDSITALPKEMIRHYTMLKEVDAKIYGPEESVGQLVAAALKAPAVPRKPMPAERPIDMTRTNTDMTDIAATGSAGNSTAPSVVQAPSVSGSLDDPTTADGPRRRIFAHLRKVMGEMLTTLDEKNHVMLTAIEGLDKQLARCDSSFPHIANEVSEEARLGSKTHWAYRDRTTDKKATTAAERTRHATTHLASTAAIQDAEGAAARSEVRREALAARKQRNNHVDSDFDDRAAQTTKKPTAGAKGRRLVEALPLNGTGLGITGITSVAPPNKRRKVEKVPMAVLPIEKAMGSVYGPTAGVTKGNGSSPRDTPALDPVRKRGRAAAPPSTSRKRANTNTSTVNSPLPASSPVTGTFPAKDLQKRSPAPNSRAQLARARQNSTQSLLQEARTRTVSSASAKPPNGNGNSMYGTTADVEKVSGLTGRSVGEVKNSMKEIVNSKGEHLVEDIGTIDGAADIRGALVVGGRSSERTMKREDTVEIGKGRSDRPPSISVATRGGGKNSKNSTPVNASFTPEATRPSRSAQPPIKRSHKKGAGIAAQMAAAAAAAATQDDETSSLPPEEEEEYDVDEPRYCYCNGVSYGEMVGCDMESCAREWFHLKCVGLQKAPSKNAKWYCDECKKKLKEGRFANGAAR